jgi:hypothetical protein
MVSGPGPCSKPAGVCKKRSAESSNLICLHAGFGDAINCEESWRACCSYIDEQFRQYFTDESGLNRKNIQDNRVHCCLYFVPPYGHGYVAMSSCKSDQCRNVGYLSTGQMCHSVQNWMTTPTAPLCQVESHWQNQISFFLHLTLPPSVNT